jgi:hypothetical protein
MSVIVAVDFQKRNILADWGRGVSVPGLASQMAFRFHLVAVCGFPSTVNPDAELCPIPAVTCYRCPASLRSK